MSPINNVILNKKTNINPIWIMRQAGRYLPEFREIRKNNQNFIELCLNTELSKEITIQPITRFDLDAAIIFSDILMIPHGLGQHVDFIKGEGPNLEKIDLEKILNCEPTNFIKIIKPVYDSIKKVKKTIKSKSCIGFAGAPWTLLLYMLNRKSPKKDFNLNTILKDKLLVKKLLKKIESTVCLHIEKQFEAGADIIQIFDSWAGLLPLNHLHEYCFQPNLNIVNYAKSKKIPIICFPRGIKKNYLNFCEIVKPNCINIDYDVEPEWAKENFKQIPIQGGMDPKILLKDRQTIKNEVENYLNIFSNYPYIFNLGHGVLPETNPDIIQFVTKLVKDRKK